MNSRLSIELPPYFSDRDVGRGNWKGFEDHLRNFKERKEKSDKANDPPLGGLWGFFFAKP